MCKGFIPTGNYECIESEIGDKRQSARFVLHDKRTGEGEKGLYFQIRFDMIEKVEKWQLKA